MDVFSTQSAIAGLYDKSRFSFVSLPKWLYQFAFLPAMNENSCCSTSSTFAVVSVLDFGRSNRYIVISSEFFISLTVLLSSRISIFLFITSVSLLTIPIYLYIVQFPLVCFSWFP